MQTAQVTIINENGLHTRPGQKFVKACKLFESEITVQKGEKTVSGKSLMKLMGAGICKDDTIQIHANGIDEDEAITYLARFVAELEG